MALLKKSLTKRLPWPSPKMLYGLSISALVAGPPSPEKPAAPLPATVTMLPPGPPTTSRMTLLFVSAIKILWEASTQTPLGEWSSALVAGPLSPLYPAVPLPATVTILPPGPPTTSRMTLLPASAMKILPEASRKTELGKLSSALVAGPLSPVYPAVPFPATEAISPVAAEISRTSLKASAMKISPEVSTKMPFGEVVALAAGPPSPLSPWVVPFPAMVLMSPVEATTSRTAPVVSSKFVSAM